MKQHLRYWGYRDREPLLYQAPETPIQELLTKNSNGEFLTRDEKNRVIMYNETKRKERLNRN